MKNHNIYNKQIKKKNMRPDFKNKKMGMNVRNSPQSFSGLTIELPSEIVVKHIPAFTIKASKIEVASIVDDSVAKKITANTNLGKIILWEGDSYDNINQWTDSDVHTKLIELYVK
jgi:hypothetical protein